jgi:hypothetical protein
MKLAQAMTLFLVAMPSVLHADRAAVDALSAEPAAKVLIDGAKAGLTGRYFDVCQPWRGESAKMDILRSNGITLSTDDAFVGAQLIGQEEFDRLAGGSGKDSACKWTLRSLQKYGLKL